MPDYGGEKQIALLYFSRNARSEGRQKAWFSAGSDEKNNALATSLIVHTSHILQASGLPVFHFHEGNQMGRSFSERLANAYQNVFDLGYEAVIAVGNDTPEIDSIDWDGIINHLSTGQCVLGPTFRRGAYLIGITAEVFQKAAFQCLPWQSSGTIRYQPEDHRRPGPGDRAIGDGRAGSQSGYRPGGHRVDQRRNLLSAPQN